jgi:hypothetical protein
MPPPKRSDSAFNELVVALQKLTSLVEELRTEISELRTEMRRGKISDAWIPEKDAARLLGIHPRTLRRGVQNKENGFPISYRNTNGRAWQYKRADITRYLRQTSVPA